MRILVVEDSLPQAESLGLVLRAEGHRPFLAGGAESARAQVETHGCDAVILDLWIPGGGREFLAWLRQQSGYEAVPVVISTGLPQEQTADLSLLPHTRVLRKPHTVPELLEALASLGAQTLHGGKS